MPAVDIEPQPLEAPLNDESIQKLRRIIESKPHYRRLQQKLADASQQLADVAGKLNDRGEEERIAYKRKQARLQANSEEEDIDEQNKHETFQAQVQSLTKKMDKSIRNVIDDQIWMEDLPDTIQQVNVKVGAATQPSQRSIQSPTQQTSQQNEQEDGADNMDLDENANELRPPSASETPSALLLAAFSAQKETWNTKSLTERYAQHNGYKTFYRVVYDAKNPGENAPPIPHPSLWFAEEEGRTTSTIQGRQDGDPDDEEDSDVEVASERIRLTCPLTLLPYTEPVTSEKCNHSYEKSAILDMLKQSTQFVPFTREQNEELDRHPARERQRRERQMRTSTVKCPECGVLLTEADLHPNPVLMRKVNRFLEAERRRMKAADSDPDEDEDPDRDDQGLPDGTQRKPVGLGSSPALRLSNRFPVKSEKAPSVIPQTQLASRTQSSGFSTQDSILDLDDDADD